MRRQSVTGKIYCLDRLGKLIRIDYNPNQPRDANGRWISTGGSGGGSGNRKSSKGGGGLAAEKVSSLQKIAEDEGIDINSLSHKARRSVLVAAIEARREGKDLREAGLLKPQKTTRKRTKSEVSKKPKEEEIDLKKSVEQFNYNYQPEVKNTLIKGHDFVSKHKLNEKLPLTKKEIEISAKIDKIVARRKQGKGDFVKDLDSIRTLQEELAKEKNKANFVQIQKHRAVLDEIIAHNKVPKLRAKSLLKRVEFGKDLSDIQKQQISDMLVEFHQVTNGMGAKTIKKIVADSDRAYTNPDGLVDVGKVVKKQTVFHEFAHHIEISDPKVAKLAAQWRDAKSDQSGVHKMSTLTGDKTYRDDEVAVKDKYLDPYVGKVYKDSDYTEVVSMGVEHFSSADKMKQLYDKDPDHYHFILGLLLK